MFDFNNNYQKIQELIRNYRAIKRRATELFDEREIYNHQKAELFARFGNRYGNVADSEARIYTEQELTQLRLELANSAGLWPLIKSMLGFGKSQREVYRELMGKLTGLLNFMEDQIRDCRSEADAIWYKLQQISEEYTQAYKSAMCYGGCTSDSDWTSYVIPETLENPRIFLGDLLKPFMTEEEQRELSGDGKILFNLCRDGEKIAVPWGFLLSAPIQLSIDYGTRTTDRARQILQSIIYQTLRSIPQYYMEFHFMDAVTSGNDFRDFIRLQQVKKNDIVMLNRKVTGGSYHLAQSYLKSEDISRGLTALVQRMTAVINEKAAYTTVTEYNAEQGMDAWIPYQMIIVQNLHEGYSDSDFKNIQYLIENGRNLGVFVVILNNVDRWENESTHSRKQDLESCFSAEAIQNLFRIDVGTDISSTCVRGVESDFRHWQTGGSHLEFIENIVEQLVAEKKLDNEFQRIFDINAPFGQMDSTNGLHIPFAINQRGDIISYSLGQALNAHGLICGGTGSGKSSLLHMLISSIVMNYTPEDVEIWLSDYKITEFYSYKTNTPPHIRFIGLSRVHDDLEDICYKIVETLEIIKDRSNTRKQLIVWLGLDSMADILADERNKRTPVLKKAEEKATQSEVSESVSEEESEKTDFNDSALDEFSALFGDMDLFGEEDINEEEPETGKEAQTSYLYDARNDIARIIHLGPTCNVFNLVIYDSASALRDFREVKTLDFNHKIAFPMSDYEAGEFLDQPRLIRELSGQLAYYHNGRAGNRFVPYKL